MPIIPGSSLVEPNVAYAQERTVSSEVLPVGHSRSSQNTVLEYLGKQAGESRFKATITSLPTTLGDLQTLIVCE